MSERLQVTLAGGHQEYLDLAGTNAHGLESLIVQGREEREWLPIEGGKGGIRVDAIVGMRLKGTPDAPGKGESDKLTRLDDERRLAGKPPTDDRSLERRIHETQPGASFWLVSLCHTARWTGAHGFIAPSP